MYMGKEGIKGVKKLGKEGWRRGVGERDKGWAKGEGKSIGARRWRTGAGG